MKRNTEKHSRVMTIANSFVKQGIGRSAATLKAWTLIEFATIGAKAADVTHGKRQKTPEPLTRYPSEQVNVALCRDCTNGISGKSRDILGYT
jgi:hypothetical protein